MVSRTMYRKAWDTRHTGCETHRLALGADSATHISYGCARSCIVFTAVRQGPQSVGEFGRNFCLVVCYRLTVGQDC